MEKKEILPKKEIRGWGGKLPTRRVCFKPAPHSHAQGWEKKEKSIPVKTHCAFADLKG